MNNVKLSSVSFFCPAYHDQDNLPILIPRVYSFLEQITDTFEIIIIEDGSPDKTGAVADSLAQKWPHTRVIHHRQNMGYGATLRDGFQQAKYEYVMYTDGDNQYDVFDLLPYLSLLDSADVLSGYAKRKAVTFLRKIQSYAYNFLVSILFFTRWRDVNCSLKIYKRIVLDNITSKCDSAFIDAEMLLRAKTQGFKITQFLVTHYKRENGLASGSSMGVIFEAIKDMIKFRLGLIN